jgi:isocitrate/isopropylmalate dehydrogenase
LFLEECWKAADELNLRHLCEDQLADSFLALAVKNPSKFDVIVCPNLFGDLISDMAGGMVGSLGLCASGTALAISL